MRDGKPGVLHASRTLNADQLFVHGHLHHPHPGTEYHYRIRYPAGRETGLTGDATFRTAPRGAGEPFLARRTRRRCASYEPHGYGGLVRRTFFHECAFSTCTGHSSDGGVRAKLAPLFARYQVDLAVQGHNNVCERGPRAGPGALQPGGPAPGWSSGDG